LRTWVRGKYLRGVVEGEDGAHADALAAAHAEEGEWQHEDGLEAARPEGQFFHVPARAKRLLGHLGRLSHTR
jgi:hypothetical protein